MGKRSKLLHFVHRSTSLFHQMRIVLIKIICLKLPSSLISNIGYQATSTDAVGGTCRLGGTAWRKSRTQFNNWHWHKSLIMINLQSWASPLTCRLDLKAEIVVGNSLMVRLVDMLSSISATQVYGNRGASGIDGLVATAAGVIKANQTPLMMLIGDTHFVVRPQFMALLTHSTTPMVIVVTNNDGGAIFDLLPVPEQQKQSLYPDASWLQLWTCRRGSSSIMHRAWNSKLLSNAHRKTFRTRSGYFARRS